MSAKWPPFFTPPILRKCPTIKLQSLCRAKRSSPRGAVTSETLFLSFSVRGGRRVREAALPVVGGVPSPQHRAGIQSALVAAEAAASAAPGPGRRSGEDASESE